MTKKRKAEGGGADVPVAKVNDAVASKETPKKRTKITFEDAPSSPAKPATITTPGSAQKPESKKPKSILKKTKSQASTSQAAEEAEAEATIEVPPPPPKTKAEKKAKRAARLSQSSTTSTSADATSKDEERPHLIYLQTYHTTPEVWKFNKNHQVQLLNDVFNLYRIPSSYNDALSSYIRGLQGAAARERLGLQARSIALQAPVEKEGEKDLEKRVRAKIIVEALEAGPKTESKERNKNLFAEVASAAPTGQKKKKKKIRGRKKRVQVESDSSSSEFESSDSDDDT